jgi:hypothetical protein
MRQQVPLKEIGKFLRAKFEPITEESLPKRWVDLIQYLDEKERREREGEERGRPKAS